MSGSYKVIQYVQGDATQPQDEGPKIIAHVCNDIGKWGRGFVLSLSERWEAPEREYKNWYRNQFQPFGLGEVQFVEVEDDIWVANMIGQRDIKPIGGRPPVRYEAIRDALITVCGFARDQLASVHMPRIGSGLAGGEWIEIEWIISATLLKNFIPVTVYDLIQNNEITN